MTAAVPRYDLAAPSVEEFQAAVRRVATTDFDTVWRAACAQARVPAFGALSQQQLTALAAALTATPGVIGVIGRSLTVRLSSYRTLSALAGATR